MTNVENSPTRAVAGPSIMNILNLLLLPLALPPAVGGAEGGPSSKYPLDGVGVDAADGVCSSPGD
jgi:hypothetical protein